MAIITNNLKGYSFISKERTRTDKLGAEVKVTIASGVPVISMPSNNSDNASILIQPEGLKYGHKAPLNIKDPIFPIFQQAAENNTAILVRFEKRRKKDIDASIPIDELAPTQAEGLKNVFNAVAGVYDYNNRKWLLVNGSSTDTKEDPEELESKINYIYSEEVSVDTFFENKVVNLPPKKIDNEERANVLLNMYVLVKDCEDKFNYSLEENKKRILAKKLLDLVDKIQMNIYELSEPDYKAYSHVKARYVLYSFVEKIKPLNKENLSNFKEWESTVLTEAVDLWSWALDK